LPGKLTARHADLGDMAAKWQVPQQLSPLHSKQQRSRARNRSLITFVNLEAGQRRPSGSSNEA
jgi:hypothetical protein